MHSDRRMLWGENLLAWSKTPRKAIATLIQLNSEYELDGPNPKSRPDTF